MRKPLLLCMGLAFAACGDAGEYGARSSAEGEAQTSPASTADAIVTRDPSAPTAPAQAPGQDAALAARDTGAAAGALPAGPGAPIVPSMLIRTGEARLEVRELEPAIARVRALAQRLGGYVGTTTLTSGRHETRAATLELKLPAARFDEALSGLEPVGRVESVNARAEDVGEEYVDLQARRTNAARLEQRLLELLAGRAGRLEDILALERELARVREEIERYDGRLRYLRTRAAVSTLTVHVHEPVPLLDDGPGANPVLRAVRQSWSNFVGFVAGFIALLGVLIPLGALLAGAWWIFRRVRRGGAS